MDDNLTYVFVAFLITWLVIGGYLWTLGRQVQNLRDEVESLTSEEPPRASESGVSSESRARPESTQA